MRMTIVDVFAEQAFAGNQLAVVHDAAALSSEQMQTIALETNFSETTFVTRQATGEADVRIFTPTHELPFAGHPTLGTAWVLTGGEESITLKLAAGAVPVSFEDGKGWLTAPAVEFGGSVSSEVAADLLNISVDDLDPDYPFRYAQVGPRFLIIGVRSLDMLKQVKINEALFDTLNTEGGVFSVFAFSADAYSSEADYAARMFFAVDGIREDPATGSANAAFAAYLRELGVESGERIVDQGVEINRPSRLYLRIGDELQVGGRVYCVLEGQLQQLP